MKKQDYRQFTELLGVAPPPKAKQAEMEQTLRNWLLLHPVLATLQANAGGLKTCSQLMYVELQREDGPRFHVMDRLYKRYSNLRREMETSAMATLVEAPEKAVEA